MHNYQSPWVHLRTCDKPLWEGAHMHDGLIAVAARRRRERATLLRLELQQSFRGETFGKAFRFGRTSGKRKIKMLRSVAIIGPSSRTRTRTRGGVS